jgi:hypothetical protein
MIFNKIQNVFFLIFSTYFWAEILVKGKAEKQMIYTTLYRKLKIEQHEPHKKTWINSGAPEGS